MSVQSPQISITILQRIEFNFLTTRSRGRGAPRGSTMVPLGRAMVYVPIACQHKLLLHLAPF